METKICIEVSDLEEYCATHGDPKLNGKGHRETFEFGRREVIVPSAQRRQVLRSKSNIIEQRRVMDNGEGHFVQGQQEALISELEDMISIAPATGEVMGLSAILAVSAGGGSAAGEQAAGGRSSVPVSEAAAGARATATTTTALAPEQGLSFGLFAPAAAPPPAASAGGVASASGASGSASSASASASAPAKAAPKTKARCKAAPAPGVGSPPGDEKKGRGRPQRDLHALAEKCVEEWAEADETTQQFFGPQLKANRRFLARLSGDISNKSDATKDMDEWKRLTKCCKQLKAILAVMDAAAKYDTTSSQLGAIYDAQVNFLDMDPQAELKFPEFLSLKRHECKLEECATGHAFWFLLTDACLASVGYKKDSEKASRVVSNAVRARIVWATCSKCAKDMEAALLSFFDLDMIRGLQANSSVPAHLQEIEEVGVIATFHRADPTDTVYLKKLANALDMAVPESKHPVTGAHGFLEEGTTRHGIMLWLCGMVCHGMAWA